MYQVCYMNLLEGEGPPTRRGPSCVMILAGSHRSLTGRVISLVGSAVSPTFKPDPSRGFLGLTSPGWGSPYLGQVS